MQIHINIKGTGWTLLDSHVVLHFPELAHDIHWIRLPGGLLYFWVLARSDLSCLGQREAYIYPHKNVVLLHAY